LTKIDVQAAGTVRADCGEKVVTVESNERILEFATVSREKNRPTSWSIANTDHVAFFE
jgi:hypothetical protein